MGQGVNDLLFVPLKEVMDKFFTFSKTECTSMTDHPLAPIITAKSFFSQKIYGFLNISKLLSNYVFLIHSFFACDQWMKWKRWMNIHLTTLVKQIKRKILKNHFSKEPKKNCQELRYFKVNT